MNDINIFMGDDLSVYQLCQLYLVRINQVNCIQIQLIGKRVEYIIWNFDFFHENKNTEELKLKYCFKKYCSDIGLKINYYLKYFLFE